MESGDPMQTMWLLYLAGGSVILALLGLFAINYWSGGDPDEVDPELVRVEAEELSAHAAAAHAEAGRAAATAAGARERAAIAEQARLRAWNAQEIAEQAYVAARQDARQAAEHIASAVRAANPQLDQAVATAGGPAGALDIGERDRAVSRAALGAYRRGEISVEELRGVFRLAADPDPVRTNQDQSVFRFQSEQRAARRLYDRAAATSRQADEEARIAEIAAAALADEAVEAATEAHEAMMFAQRYAQRRRVPWPRRPR